ncbi:uncharacterized protein METZ01_LOCUS327194, partial [marine metagenome]
IIDRSWNKGIRKSSIINQLLSLLPSIVEKRMRMLPMIL